MASNTIVNRVKEFLKRFPPFDKISEEDLKTLSENIRIKYFEPDQAVFNEGDTPGKYIYLVREGMVRLSERNEPVDICDEGDIFGVRSMLSGKPYVLQALTGEDSLLYLIPIAIFKPLLAQYSEVALYFAAGLAAGQIVLRKEQNRQEDGLKIIEEIQPDGLQGLNTFSPKRSLVTTDQSVQIQEVARKMTHENVGSVVIVNKQGLPKGIVTDTDLRKKVVTGHQSIESPVRNIMSYPVITIKENTALSDILILMMQRQVHHLCFTEDGTPASRATGIISERDLLLEQGSHPAILVKEIFQSRDTLALPRVRDKAEELLTHYIRQEVSIKTVTGVITAINDAIIKTAVRHAQQKLEKEGLEDPGLRFCWLSLGSEGREEQLLRTDQDNALIYEDPKKDQKEIAQTYFLQLAEVVIQVLLDCGFAKCPADIMAKNPRWCASLSQWKSYFHQWIMVPEEQALMYSTIFFDLRPVEGDATLVEELEKYIQSLMDKQSIFLHYLAKNALQNPPPLSFFKNLVVEKSGEHKNEFDIKLRAMMPLIDIARLLTLYHQVKGVKNTIHRFNKLCEIEPEQEMLFREAIMAFELLLRIRTKNGLANHDPGRYIPVDQLNKLERQMLRNAFEPIKVLQQLVSVRFQLNYFR